MTSETDAEFIDGAEYAYGHHMVPQHRDRLFALSRRGASMQWRPIDEAPETGARVTLYVPLYGSGSGHWDNGWHAHFCLNKEAQPTHWMPLPPPPKGAEE